MNIVFENQPARSPDYNILDLGIYCAIQSLQNRKRAFDIDALVVAVQEAFDELDRATLDKCFVTLQSVLHESMLRKGGMDYKTRI